MATPVWFTGFEYGLATPSVNGTGLIDAITGTCTIRDDVGIPHSGTYALRTVATAGVLAYISRNMTAGQTFVGRFYIYLPALPASDRIIYSITTVGHKIQILYDVTQVSFSIGIDGATTQLGTVTVGIDTWYCIDIKANTSANPWLVDWQIDSVAQAQLSSAHAAENMSVIDYGLRTVGVLTVWYDDPIHSLTAADYPIGPGGTYGLRPDSDGVHNNAANTMENSAGTDIDGTPAWSLLDEDPWTSSIASDYVKQSTIGAARYCEINFADVTAQPTYIGVEGLLEYGASGANADTGGCIIRDGAGTETAVWGKSGALQDYSETTAFYKHAIIPAPGGTWDKSEIDALKCRFGFSDDVTDVPRWVAIMLEVAFSLPASSILMTNAAEEIEWIEETPEVRMTNAAEEIEWTETIPYVRLTNAAIMVEWRIGAIGNSASHTHLADEPVLVYHAPPSTALLPEGAPVVLSTSTSMFVQFEPGGPVYYLGACTFLDEMPNPRTGFSSISHRIGPAIGDYIFAGERLNPPGMISMTIGRLHSKTASWLDKVGCRFTLFTLQRCWGLEGTFSNWVVGQSVSNCKIINDEVENVSQRDSADEMLRNYEILGYFPRRDYYEMVTSQKTTTEVNDANCITAIDASCGGGCVRDGETCQTIFVGCDAAGGASANVLRSLDKGKTWSVCATDPFGINLNVVALKSFWVDADTLRLLSFRGTLAGSPLQCGYSDDLGATWTLVNVGSLVAEGVVSPNALKIYDRYNIRVGTDSGRVYASNDDGLTWSEQATALVASGGGAIYAIDFISYDFGVAVGENGLRMYTKDGGETWTALAVGANIYWDVEVFTRKRFLIGSSNGYTYMTYDGGITWTTLRNWSLATYGAVKSLDFVDVMTGFMGCLDTGGIGYLFRSIDGGYSWNLLEKITAGSGLNEVLSCSINEVFGVGDDFGGSAMILEGNGFSTLI